MDVRSLLKVMVDRESSDLYLTVDAPPIYRIHGVTQQTDAPPFTNEQLEALALALMRGQQRSEFEEKMEMNLALYYKELGRFRVNIFRQKGNVGVVFRHIKAEIQTVEQLQLPPIIKDIAMTKRGLVLVVGATGSGKSTSLAAMIDHRNTVHQGHIITVEDPIEFVHQHKKSIITQREVGFDTLTFQNALKNTLRQAPDVILIGEIRDTETMEAAITFAETGHLCIGTLHSNNANQAIERIMNFFPVERHAQIYLQLSLNLRAIISQRLIPSVDGKRVPALEIMLDTPRIKDLIKKAEVDILKEAMEQGVDEGCQTFDHVLFQLYKENKITLEQALINADSANNLRLKIKLEGLKGDEAVNALLDKQIGDHGTDAFKIQGGASGNVTPLRKR
ncbi:MAG: PilT/PilU family type 4a pilus ATPase [Nitrospira sp.]|jgi:twitching motility protein PilU|nr:PilT/PilU family type 4a pilus ATPase [Nitrospira sp.]MDH4244520.1 PilT/PilU family type 4a pilus ATPase [Nitrospira sp.]MDH4357000.1 PilT/PilU family type 4a pilus ATPase [Nitrospira sp.]MDH5320063.1 PilT/PilU family type 4a pilus ATPase [Nitrospira sp.]NGZ95443.1 type IV pili twitching motility protein PilT [Nitrospira sp. WS110]